MTGARLRDDDLALSLAEGWTLAREASIAPATVSPLTPVTLLAPPIRVVRSGRTAVTVLAVPVDHSAPLQASTPAVPVPVSLPPPRKRYERVPAALLATVALAAVGAALWYADDRSSAVDDSPQAQLQPDRPAGDTPQEPVAKPAEAPVEVAAESAPAARANPASEPAPARMWRALRRVNLARKRRPPNRRRPRGPWFRAPVPRQRPSNRRTRREQETAAEFGCAATQRRISRARVRGPEVEAPRVDEAGARRATSGGESRASGGRCGATDDAAARVGAKGNEGAAEGARVRAVGEPRAAGLGAILVSRQRSRRAARGDRVRGARIRSGVGRIDACAVGQFRDDHALRDRQFESATGAHAGRAIESAARVNCSCAIERSTRIDRTCAVEPAGGVATDDGRLDRNAAARRSRAFAIGAAHRVRGECRPRRAGGLRGARTPDAA